MNISKPRTLDDLPKITVTSVRHVEPSDAEYQLFEIQGSFSASLEKTFTRMREEDICQWFWLLYGERECLTSTLKSFDKEKRTVVLSCLEKEEPKISGLELAYLSPYWQAYNVWMVSDPDWGWERKQFQGADAIAEDYEAETVSFLEGREVRVWTKLEPVGSGRGQSLHYPAADQTAPVRPGTRVIRAAWGHENCDLCNKHIDAGSFGWSDPDERWLCESCHRNYVVPHDLSFINEL